MMNSSTCLRSFSQLSLDRTAHASLTSRTLLAPQIACFSTSTARYNQKKGMAAAPKRGTRTLNVKKGRKGVNYEMGKRPAPGERKAQRKRIVLSNDNALPVSWLRDLERSNVLEPTIEGQMMGLPERVVDALRAEEAFKPTQGWGLFRRPATLMRKETVQLAGLVKEIEDANAQQQPRTIRRIISGDRMSGKSTLLLQGLAIAHLRDWFVINLPEANDITNAHTDYAPLPGSQPLQYTQDTYTANLLRQMLKANPSILESTPVVTDHKLPFPLPPKPTLKHIVEHGMANPETSWVCFTALWEELSQPGRPPILFAIDSLAHVMRNSEYMSAEFKPIHAFDLTLIRLFVDLLSGQKTLANGGIILGSLSQSNKPLSVVLDHFVTIAEALQSQPAIVPVWNPYLSRDQRVVDALRGLEDPKQKDFDILRLGGLSKPEARAVIEYYAESGMLRHTVNDSFVTEKWSLAGMGNMGELEKASVRLRL
ncbi:hypothetical protein DM02DRAFT_655606 [Periconia macrospinosa]|uniref:Small ribosomal subunit protein mS29 n=1 Tax=Periconia macrospinosa TaxID=97972 RepID=A0A2V1DQH7_9PLEO|nr:hypothetical protein DM02DRAFT_655606 [Periconia macrospinosa]